MALNPYTLNHLYEKGILDYVPTDLGANVGLNLPVSPTYSMTNPYLDMATQGGLYQRAINTGDSFTPINTYNGIGSMSNAGGFNTFFGNGVGASNNSSIANTFGFNNNIGSNSNAGIYNSFIGNGVGDNYNGGGFKIFGGFADTQNNLQSGAYKTMAIINNTPRFVLGLIAGAIGVGSLMIMFKKGKKPDKKTQKSFLSKLNPFNWFKKTKQPTQVQKTSSSSKLNPRNWFKKKN